MNAHNKVLQLAAIGVAVVIIVLMLLPKKEQKRIRVITVIDNSISTKYFCENNIVWLNQLFLQVEPDDANTMFRMSLDTCVALDTATIPTIEELKDTSTLPKFELDSRRGTRPLLAFQAISKYIEKNPELPTIILFITDGESDFPLEDKEMTKEFQNLVSCEDVIGFAMIGVDDNLRMDWYNRIPAEQSSKCFISGVNDASDGINRLAAIAKQKRGEK